MSLLLIGISAAAAVPPGGPGNGASGQTGPVSLRVLIPPAGDLGGWARDGEPQEFAGEDLFTYIDGGAEIYQEYGFRRALVQDFTGPAAKSVSLEIFEMVDPAAAFGMFTLKRSGRGTRLDLGSGGELEDYYLNFWKGRYLVTLTGFDDAAETMAGLRTIAAAVDARIADKAGEPGLVAALPEGGLVPGSVKYLRGLLGLNTVYPFYTARGLTFREAVKGDYGDGTILIVLDYGSADSRRAAWDELLFGHLVKTERFKGRGPGPGGEPVFEDGRGRTVIFGESGPRLIVGINGSPDAALDRVRQARDRGR